MNSTDQNNSDARVSLRLVTGLEVASVMLSVLIVTWAIIPLQAQNRWLIAIPGLLAVALMAYSHRLRGETLRSLGFSLNHFGRALKLVAGPTILGMTVFAMIGYLNNSFHRGSKLWLTILLLPFWGLFQQYILQGFIYRRVRFLLVDENAASGERKKRITFAMIATAVIFAGVHLPNPALTLLTLIGGLVWSWVYERAPNLIALAFSHAAMSVMLMTSLPPWMLESMSVGYKHFMYQPF